jgi:hypothetical protein
MDGLGLCVEIRHRWPLIELIITSGQQSPPPHEMPDRCLFLAKPYDERQLLAALKGFVGISTRVD